jgi:hypothetical protein
VASFTPRLLAPAQLHEGARPVRLLRVRHASPSRSERPTWTDSRRAPAANPKVSADKVLYDVSATFTEGSKQFNYTLVDGIAYSSGSTVGSVEASVTCLDSQAGNLPPVNDIVKGLSHAVRVSSDQGDTAECPEGESLHTTVNGLDFEVCALGPLGFTMHGSDMDITVEILRSRVDVEIPVMEPELERNCMKTASSTAVTSIARALLTGRPLPDGGRKLKAAFDFSFQGFSSCECSSTPRPCVFIHGMGVEEEMPTNVDNFTEYWGEHLVDHAPRCSSMQFTHLDTVSNTWTSAAQQEKVCDRALAVSETSTDSVIVDTIVVTHSMGNLMLAGAIANERCSLDSSSTWIGLAAPMKGSMASDFVQDSCSGETNAVWEKIGNVTGRCPASPALKSLACEGESYSTSNLNAAYNAAQRVYRENVYAVMCSKYYSGILSTYQVEFWALGTLVPHKSDENDGMVEFESCAAGIPDSQFGESARDRFYKTNLNHYDMEFLSGDAVLNGQKMPLKWFECLL